MWRTRGPLCNTIAVPDMLARLQSNRSICAWPRFWFTSGAFQTSFSKGTDRDTQCASHRINIAMTFTGPVVWLAGSFWQAQDNRTPRQCVNSQTRVQINQKAPAWWTAGEIQTGAGESNAQLPQMYLRTRCICIHAVCVVHTLLQVRACLRVKGSDTDFRSHRKTVRT